jgi:hypothetical protein
LVVSGVASAALFRAYVSSTGNDSNDCTLPRPCRLLPKALTTIASGGDAIFIGTAGVRVTLRNLVIVRLGSGGDGIGINAAAEVDVEDCEISNMGRSGIAAFDANAKVRVTSTRLRNNVNGIYARGPVVVNVDHLTSVGNATAGVFADTGSIVNVSNSILRDNGNGAYAIASTLSLQGTQSDSNGTAGLFADTASHVTVRDSGFANNGSYGVIANASGGEGGTLVTLVHNIASGSGIGYRVAASAGGAFIFADGNQCDCGSMFSFAGAGGVEQIETAGNNTPLNSGSFTSKPLFPLQPFI